MAMRPRGGGGAAGAKRGARSGVVRAVYEDIRPVAEWKQDDEFHVLNIYLPGFMKEQIKVSTEGRNTLRVRGERLVAGNKWNRFSEDYQVPDDGEMNSVRAKFQGGVLAITVPKGKTGALPPPKTEGSDDIRQQPTPGKSKEKESSSHATDGKTRETDEKGKEPQKSRDTRMEQREHGNRKQPNPQKEALPTVNATKQSTDKNSSEPEKTLGDPEKEQDQDSNQRGRSFTPLKRTTVAHDTVRKESDEPKDKHIAVGRPDDVRKTTVDKEGRETIELPGLETDKTTESEKDGATGIPEKKTNNKELYGGFTKEKYKKAVKGLTELNEERQSLVNMGVAMLVIVALTAYVTYNFASAKERN